MGDALAELRLFRRDFIEVHVEEIARDAAKGDDVRFADSAAVREQRIARLQVLEVLAERMDRAFVDIRAAHVFARDRRQHGR